MSNSESFTKPEPAAPVSPIPYNENLEMVLSAIPHKPNRDYLRQAVQTMLAYGFTHITGEGWKSPLQRQPHNEPLSFDAARALLRAAALESSRSGKGVMGDVIAEAVEVVAPLPTQEREAREEAEAAVRTLEHLGYTYHGGVYWKPPLGKKPLCLDTRYAMAVAVLELDGYSWDADRVNWRKSIIPGIGEDHSLRVREHLLPHGVAAIMSERIRQIHVESYTVADDLDYDNDELVGAALAYVSQHWYRNGVGGRPPQSWPWDAKFWKPVDRRRDLERAGALIAAELDRLNAVEQGQGAA